jgi:flagellar basal-body rod protein FlgF
MIYGLYLSATGVLANSHRQDVIANNLANSETVGFKRHLAAFQERPVESQELNRPDLSDPTLDHIGGGFLLSPTMVDMSQGELESTGNHLDAAIVGKGFFSVMDEQGQTTLTRDGQFMLDRQGQLILTSGRGEKVLGADGKPIQLIGLTESQLQLEKDGTITHAGNPISRIGLFDVADPSQLTKQGGNLLGYPDLPNSLKASNSELRAGFTERANVDPANELVLLMETQRQLEANANMIRYQDQAMNKLVNEVGKIS